MFSNYHPLKLLVAVAAAVYFFWCAATPSEWRLLNGVNLLIHEGGHIICLPFGHFVHMIGGTLFQLLMPTLFIVHFYRHGQPYSSAIVLFWLGHSFLDISVYAGDAVAMKLPLLGGRHSIHDWNYLLTELGLLDFTRPIAITIYTIGAILITLATIFSIKHAYR